ncbi:uncharacterized protein LOC123524872 isoform X2 [Mercenaria mercenaria]|nr:uncharacterized protein LOC123524872 isoform X2 [Mercenaria mercenaria]
MLEVIEDDKGWYDIPLMVRRVACRIGDDNSVISRVSLTTLNFPCSLYHKHYIKPTILLRENEEKMAMCNKYLYRSVNATRLVEWIEVHRFFGVDKFTVHYHPNLDPFAKRVIHFYEREGIMETLALKGPPTEGRKKLHLFNDEHLALLDCKERHRHFKFAIDIDRDEFLVPNVIREKELKLFLMEAFKQKKVGVLSLYVSVHITSWKPTNTTHPMLLGQYEDATHPLIDRIKNVYMPSRVYLQRGYIHDTFPKEGFTREFIDPDKILLHHFRTCRPQWNSSSPIKKYKNGKIETIKATCGTFSKVRYESVKALSNINTITEQVQKVSTTLRI